MTISMDDRVFERALQWYDRVVFLREQFFACTLVQVAGALFFVASLVVAVGFFTYWAVCAYHILMAAGEELTDQELNALQWARRLRAFVVSVTGLYSWSTL
jgi:hypothetical protein